MATTILHPDAHLPICAIREPRKLKGTENRGGGESMGSEGGAGCPVSPIPPAGARGETARGRGAAPPAMCAKRAESARGVL